MMEALPDLIDTHCHLTTADRAALPELFERAFKCGVRRMVCIGAADGIEAAPAAVALATEYPHVWASVGIHPHDAGSYTDLTALEPLLSHPKVVAIGETGLDYFRDWAPKEKQVLLFQNSIAVAKRVKKPLIIHCRDAEEDTVRVLRECGADEVGGVFHCFAGNSDFAADVARLNFLISFTGNLTFKKAEPLREVVRNRDLKQIMLETDMPYMAPEPFRGGTSEPMHVYQVALKVAEVKGISLEEVARQTTENAERLFGLRG